MAKQEYHHAYNGQKQDTIKGMYVNFEANQSLAAFW